MFRALTFSCLSSALSYYPAEKEICFAPLLALEVLSDKFDCHGFRVGHEELSSQN